VPPCSGGPTLKTHGSTADFVGGKGIRLRKPNPMRFARVDWARMTVRDQDSAPSGGAILLAGDTGIGFLNCRLQENQARHGGALTALGLPR
jgi:hypothetical protein